MVSWDHRYMQLAELVAGWSKDPSTKVGAVLVGRDRRQVAFGYNGFPPGVLDSPNRLNDRSVKYKLTQHAERNVLDNAQFDSRGGTLVSTMHPCSECAKSIVSKGIARVVCPHPPADRPEWLSEAQWADTLFKEVGIEVRYLP